jgi:hemoglobin/transferrin/lactoferrin receptor protein
VDGARQNDLQAPGMKSPLYIDPYFIRDLEVLRGASSSLYGAGGNGGVLAIKTISARDFVDGASGVGGGARAGYNSSDSSTHFNARIFAVENESDILIAAGKHDWDKIKQPGGTYINPNDGSSNTGLIKYGIQPDSLTRLEVSHQLYQSDNLAINNPQANTYKQISSQSDRPLIQPTSVDQSNTIFKIAHGNLKNLSDLYVEASAYRSSLRVQVDPYATNPSYGNFAATVNNYQKTQTNTDGFNVMGMEQFGSHRVVIGGDAYTDNLNSWTGSTGAVGSVNPAGKKSAIGGYLQDEYNIGSGWSFTPTVRYDSFQANQANSTQPENNHNRISPKVTISWGDNQGLMIYGGYGEGFRSPSVVELYQYLQTPFALSNFQRNTNLRPEIDRSGELGAKFVRSGVLKVGDKFEARVALFQSQVKDLINSVNLGQVVGGSNNCATTGLSCNWQYQNISRAERVGGELEAKYSHDLWQYKVGYGQVRVRNTDTNENLFSMPDKLTAQIRRNLPQQSLSVFWNSTFVAAQDYDSTLLRRRGGYAAHDIFIAWKPVGEKYQVNAGVTNLFDKAYMTYQSANIYAQTYQPARSFLLSLNADF